jgi:uncharacterized membrane protein
MSHKRFWLPLACIIGALLCLPLWVWGVPSGNDLPHHLRLAMGFYDSLLNGDVYPSWLAMTNGGLGDPSVRFYPPGLYVLLAGFRLLTGNWYFATLITFSILTILSSLGSYLYAHSITPSRYAIVAAVIYPLTPFHANELYQAGMYGQYAAACFVPFVFYFLEKLLRQRSWQNVVFFAFSYALVLLFHVPMAVFVTISAVIYAAIRLWQEFDLKAVGMLFIGFDLGAAISAFYWVPMIHELGWKKPSGAGQGEWFNYANNFIFTTLPGETANYWVPILVVFTLLLFIPALFLGNRHTRPLLAPCVLAMFTFLLSMELSKPLWDSLRFLQETQFPWRWLTLTSLFLSVLSVAVLSEIHSFWKTPRRPIAMALVGLMLIVVAFTFSQVSRTGLFIDRSGLDQETATLRGSATNQDFLPVWASAKPTPMTAEVETDRAVTVETWQSERKRFHISDGEATDVKTSLLYYPLWKAKGNDEPLETHPDADGILNITVPPNASTITVDFVEPWTTPASRVLSLAAFMVT